ncbi:MAG: hypothetical protein PUB19_07790 [Lachnospiraceae bacterium]|nr:hypothetical protein [Lachnospiraceae bacterium]
MKRKTIKTTITFSVVVVFAALFCLAFRQKLPDGLVGEWKCADTAEGSEQYFGFYALRIEKNGTFSLYDAEAGNPGISGKMRGEKDAISIRP